MDLTQDDVIHILKLLEESEFNELHLEMGDLKLVVSKGGGTRVTGRSEPAIGDNAEPTSLEKTNLAVPGQQPEPPITPTLEEDTFPVEQEGLIAIESPMLGTFYRASKPTDPPFVEVGTIVTEEDTVCIVEVMKLFSSIKAGVRGRIVKICAENGEMVEYKQPLFLIEKIEEDLEKEEKINSSQNPSPASKRSV